MTIIEKQNELIKEFSAIEGWEDRYKKIISIGKDLPPINEKYQVEKYKVKGCQSQVWMFAELDGEKKVIIHGDSDAMIVRGLVALLLRVYNGSGVEEILSTKPSFIEELGFAENLSPSRTNGLGAMIKQIYMYAFALSKTQNLTEA